MQMTEPLEHRLALIYVLSQVGSYCTSARTDLMCPLFPDKSSYRCASEKAKRLCLTLQEDSNSRKGSR